MQSGLDRGEIGYSGGGAIVINGGVVSTLTWANNYMYNMYIHDYARFVSTVPAVSVTGVGNNVSHCHIAYGAASGTVRYAFTHSQKYNMNTSI